MPRSLRVADVETDRPPQLASAAELLTSGGDSRLRVDPVTRLNAYGCSPTPRPEAITFASTTATSISAQAYEAVEACRRRVRAADPQLAWQREVDAVRQGIRDHYELEPGDVEIVLTPSGTDGELCALAVHRHGRVGVPSTNLLIGPEETGTGVGLAAAGRHFADITAHGVPVAKGEPIAGLGDDVAVASVALRAPDGTALPRAAVDLAVARAAERAIAEGRRVLLHILDLSKTGLLAPRRACVDLLVDRSGAALDVLVDACQARLGAASVRDYLAAGFMVLITGSKFFTGPPFAGALLLPPAIAARLRRGPAPQTTLPAGLAAYASRLEWPAAVAANLPIAVNRGLVTRWVAALAEMRAFAAVPPTFCREVLERFGRAVRTAIDANPDLMLHPAPPPGRRRRDATGDSWDALQTIFSFSVRGPDGARLDVEALRRLHHWLNRDLSSVIGEPERDLAALCCHIGQPVSLGPASGRVGGALRLAAGARLVSGVWGDPALGADPEARLARETADALQVLAKISLILRHWRELADS